MSEKTYTTICGHEAVVIYSDSEKVYTVFSPKDGGAIVTDGNLNKAKSEYARLMNLCKWIQQMSKIKMN